MIEHPSPRLNSETLLLALILLTAALLRLMDLETIRYNIDHAYPIWQALLTLDTGTFPIIGQPSSVLFANPPLTGYLFLPILALTRSITVVYVVVILLNTAAVAFCYQIARDLLRDYRLALIAAFLMAVNPWLIEYSRTTWVQCLLPFGVSGLLWLLVPVLTGAARHPARRLLIALVWLTALVQTYLLAYFMLLPVGLLLLIFYRRIIAIPGWRTALAVGTVVLVAATALYAFGLFGNPQLGFGRAGNFTASPASLSGEALSHAVRLVTGSGFIGARAMLYLTAVPGAGTAESILQAALLILLIAGILLAVWTLMRSFQSGSSDRGQDRRDAAVILLLWWVLPVLAMSYTSNMVHIFYQLLGLPAGYILAAWAAQPLIERLWPSMTQSSLQPERQPVSRWFTTAGVIGVVSAVTLLTVTHLHAAADEIRQTSGGGMLYGIPLGDGIRLAQAMREAQPVPDTRVFTNIEPLLMSGLLGRWTPVITDARPPDLSIIPDEGGIYVQFTGPGDELRQPLFSDAHEVLTLADGYSFALFSYPPELAERLRQGNFGEDTRPVDAVSRQGLALKRYSLTQNRRGRWTLISFWQAHQPGPEITNSSLGLFVHVFNPLASSEASPGSERTQILNGEVVPGYVWQPGDWIVQRVRFWTETPYWLQIGFFDVNRQFSPMFTDNNGGLSTFVWLDGTETR